MKIYKLWMIFAISLICVLSYMAGSSIYQVIASIAGVIYVIGVARENKYSIFFGIINAGIYGVIMFLDKVYGTAIYDIFYCIPIMCYTYITWGKKKDDLDISKCETKNRCYIIILSIILTLIYYVIATKLGVNYALADAIMIVFGAVGMYLISKKKIEQWYFFIMSNISSIILWVVKCNENISNLPLLIMWFVYLINNSYGLYVWNRKLKNKC